MECIVEAFLLIYLMLSFDKYVNMWWRKTSTYTSLVLQQVDSRGATDG